MNTDAERRLKAIETIALDILARDDSDKDERFQPELRDVVRLARGEEPRTNVGRAAWEDAERAPDAEPEGG